ncbi:ArsR/SmtB family transcription factor [Arthrobacter sp. RIT-PI-e]|uniref:ArsR/SmtB family transcription factor n=1 Tax=Arthrobacter sp. RIT-PI-e TaxID=1681197 RepID=UPI0006762049|nr:metalloregulator ArsR/SmtB family transcription factor [Arthrobacter sp. RIT-PI-e]
MTINYDMHQHDDVALVFRALAEPARLSLVHCLADGPHRVGELSTHLGLAQSTVSAHLAVLRSAGLVAAAPDGRATLYRLAHPGLDDLLHAGERLLTPDAGGSQDDGGPHGHHAGHPLQDRGPGTLAEPAGSGPARSTSDSSATVRAS